MTMSMGNGWSLAAAAPDAPPAGVRISANRRRLERQAPTLAFTIVTQKPFVEVLLTTDKALFDPANAARRAEGNFFASRSFGLTRTTGSDTTYFVPAGVLRALLGGAPPARALFFTAIGYDDASGRGAAPAATPAELGARAPSVEVAADFTARDLTRAFGTALERLVRHPDGDAPIAPAAPIAAPLHAGALSGEEAAFRWTGRGEIRVPDAAQQAWDDEDDEDERLEAAAMDVGDLDADGFERDDLPVEQGVAGAQGAADAEADAGDGAGQDGYDDGFGALGDEGGTPVAAQSSPYDESIGAEPAELADEEEEVASAYSDEADEELAEEQSAEERFRVPRPPAPQEQRRVFEQVARRSDGRSLYDLARPTANGLAFGVGAFDQRSGALGRLLALMHGRDAGAFQRVFGGRGDALLQVANADTPEARLAPVDGKALTEPPWPERFAAAGAADQRLFRGAQNELLSTLVFEPLWPVAYGLGLTSDRALAVVTALGIHMGAEAAAQWLVARLSPAQTGAQAQQALAALRAPDLGAFQERSGLPRTGQLDPLTHAALAWSLRRLGPSSPLVVQQPTQMLESIVRHVGAGGVASKLEELRRSPALSDAPR